MPQIFFSICVLIAVPGARKTAAERAREQGFQLAAITPETMPVIFPYN